MAAAKQTGEYSYKFTSSTLGPGPAGGIVIQGNCEEPQRDMARCSAPCRQWVATAGA
jgi:hypothetical protein